MSRSKSQSGFIIHLLGNVLLAALGVVLLRGFGMLPNWALEFDFLVAGSVGMLSFLVGRLAAVKATDKAWRDGGWGELALSGLEELPTPILLLNPDSSILFANRGFRELVQVPVDRLIGKSLDLYCRIEPQGHLGAGAPWSRLIQDGLQHASSDLVVARFDTGDVAQFQSRQKQQCALEERRWQVDCTGLFDRDRNLQGVLVSFEIPGQMHGREGSESAAISADKQAMVHLSHEIRSPMNALLGYIRLLKNGQSRDEIERQEQLDIVHKSGVRVLQLIDQILEHAKLQNGCCQVAVQDCSPFSILTETRELYQLQAVEKGLQLKLVIRDSLPAVIRTDPLKLQQMLNNLVANGIKFTAAGSVIVYVQMVTIDQAECLEIKIIDTGAGIPKENIRQIFDPFFQLKSNSGRSFGGAGLGLAISRNLADKLGAKLEVQSAVGTGTVFTLRLNIEPTNQVARLTHREFIEREASRSRRPPRSEANLLSGMQVMIVDDDASHRRLFQLYLENRGARTVQAANGKQALEIVKRQTTDLVLIDMQMPVMDGIETTICLRRMGYAQPIIGISANSEAYPGCHDVIFGFSGWLQKPVESRRLDLLLTRLLSENPVLNSSRKRRFDLVPLPPLEKLRREPGIGTLQCPDDPALGSQHVQIPNLGQQAPVSQFQLHPAHPAEHLHTGFPVGRKKVRPPSGPAGFGTVQTFHSSLSASDAGFADLAPLFLETLRNKLDEIKENRGEQRDQTMRQFVHWLKGTGAACGFHEFDVPVLDLEKAMDTGGEETCDFQLVEIEAIANAIEKSVLAD